MFHPGGETFGHPSEVSSGMKTEVMLFSLTLMAIFIVGFSLAFRYKKRELQHQERMAALDKGLPLPPLDEPASPPQRSLAQTYLLRGLMWLLSGLAIVVFLLGVTLTTHHELPASIRVHDANQAKANGATDEQIRAIMNDREQNGMAPGACLIGLIPIGVGLAYLITYRVERPGRAA